jgi:drug/metabolite transporter (DMT)-like permease
LIVNLNPIVMPFLMARINHERIRRHELVGTLIAMTGVVALIGRSYQVGAATMTGDAICFFSMVVFCGYLALSRRVAVPGRSLLAYLVPLYGMTGAVCLACAALVQTPWPSLTARDLLPLVGLGLVPTVIGHSILNHSIRVLRGQVVMTVNLLQVVFAGVMAYYLLHEPAPPLRLYVAGAVITIGMLVVVDMIRWRQ